MNIKILHPQTVSRVGSIGRKVVMPIYMGADTLLRNDIMETEKHTRIREGTSKRYRAITLSIDLFID